MMRATALPAATLDVLVLEDRPEDAELMIAQLRRDGFAPAWTRVDTEAAFAGALRPDLDLILADYSLPQFSAAHALRILIERQIDVPFIVVTGSIGEEPAVDCLRHGAADYLLKDRLSRLGAAVRHAIGERALRADKRRVEQALRTSELRYRRLFECAQDGILILDAASGVILDANPAATEMLGRRPAGCIGRTPLDVGLFGAEQMQRLTGALERTGSVRDVLVQIETPHGILDIELVATVYSVGAQSVIQCNLRDITERMRADQERQRLLRDLRDRVEELKASREYIRHIVGASPAMLYSCGPDPPFPAKFITDNIARQLGYAPDDFTRDPLFWRRCIHPDDVEQVLATQSTLLETRGVTMDYRFQHRDGRYVWLHDESKLLRDSQGRPTEIAGYCIDVTDRKRAEDAVAERDRYFRRLIENASDVISVHDIDGTYSYVSPAAERVAGFRPDEMIGRSVFEFVHPDDEARVKAALAETTGKPGAVVSVELRQAHRDGTWRTLEALATPLVEGDRITGAVVNSRDVTDRRRLEEELRMAQKMEAIGRLAGGVAHDFNNLLTAIFGYSKLLRDRVPADSPLCADIDEIRRAGESAASLTRQLRAFSRRQILEPAVLDLNAVITDMSKLLRRTIGEDIALETSLAADLACVVADRGQIEQVLMNLSVNARDAMPKGGTVRMRTEAVTLRSPVRRGGAQIPPGDYVLLTVEDTGCGMDANILAHMFEPFFTTKPRGQGTGLGLPTVYGIIAQSGGYIAAESTPGSGTLFAIYLPPSGAPASTSFAAAGPVSLRGSETVLIVEDDDMIRSLTSRALEANGYTVITAADGESALRVSEQHTGVIDLLLTDVVLAGMSGVDLAAALARAPRDAVPLSRRATRTTRSFSTAFRRGPAAFCKSRSRPSGCSRKCARVSVTPEPRVPDRLDAALQPMAARWSWTYPSRM